ncbi:toxin [Bacillus sp. FJAT-49736]|uniref:anthrax toxin lethal factor-related metalloendopeptidase n=1 Tax=Bacillus sp. FJAT-49736 TaxID=2833582 RepID=UPI001BC8F2F5|nr:toxin [Bacillus sp. FJAT-49736]MBS4173197.1 toxin [Bacillus sp. FJAT-49736]
MHKASKYVFIIVVILLLGLSKSSLDGILLKNSGLFKTVQLRSPLSLGDMVVLPKEKNYDRNEVKKIISRLDHLPPSILKRADSKGIKIKLFQGKLTDNPTAAYLKGKTPRGYANHSITWDDVPGIGGSKTVLIKIGCSEKGKGHGSVNLELHELAHSLEHYLYDGKNEQSTFDTIWKQEAPKLFPGNAYFIDYQEEYFAECFAMFFYSTSTKIQLKKFAPFTYEYISKLS